MYILQSKKTLSYYVGYSRDVQRRLAEHNRGKVASTKPRAPYEVVYTEPFADEVEARQRERFIKRQKSRKYVEQLVRHALVAQLD